jgi:hypothetical protein
MAQLRFAGPSNQAPAPAEHSAGFRSEESIRQAQFQPVPPAGLAPQLPSAADEIDLAPAPPSTAGRVPAGETGGGQMLAEEIPAPMTAGPVEMTWQENWGDAFNPELMQQEQAAMYSTSDWFRRGFWYSQADVVAMLRTESQIVHISADNSGGGLDINSLNAPLLSTKEVNPTYAPGTRLTLGRFLGQDVINRD